MNTIKEEMLIKKIETKSASVGVVGLGYVGLPLALEIAQSGFIVYGIDTSLQKVNSLREGMSYIIDTTDENLNAVVNKNFFPTANSQIIAGMDVIIICVPTPLSEAKEPDVSYIKNVVSHLVEYMKKGTLIVLESTTYPGTTEELIKNVIEESRGFKVGEDFYVCYSPERVDPGNKEFNTKNTPKVMGGITPNCLKVGVELYSHFIETVIPVSSTAAAETVKLLENTFRSINIAFINELTIMCNRMGIDIWEVIDAASSKPFGFTPFYPGPGIGGHCIPLDPVYLSWKAKMNKFYNRFIELSNDVNDNMPKFVVERISDILNDVSKPIKNSKILLVGLAYKKDVDDVRESPALEVYKQLKLKGADVGYYDPYVKKCKINQETVFSESLTEITLENIDLVVVLTNHSNIDYRFITENSKLVFDTRNATRDFQSNNVVLL